MHEMSIGSKPQRSQLNPALERLDVLVGDWNIEITSTSFDPDPSAVVHGRASFHWLEDRAFLRERFEIEDSKFPRGIAIIGPDDSADTYCILYFDSRGVSRIYPVSLQDNAWKMWRDFPGFSQRFIGIFEDNRNRISARWEKPSDGSNWEHDVDITYTRSKSST
jgi:hypothetical protein